MTFEEPVIVEETFLTSSPPPMSFIHRLLLCRTRRWVFHNARSTQEGIADAATWRVQLWWRKLEWNPDRYTNMVHPRMGLKDRFWLNWFRWTARRVKT